jgi:predicted dehydrogenase
MAINVGIVGLGWPGRKHAESLTALGARVVAVADLDPVRTAQVAEQYDARGYAHWSALLEGESELDAVVLATPPSVRLEPIDEICDRELAIFCEKPPALDMATARRAARAIRRARVVNAVGFHYRWSLCAAAMRELIRQRPRLFARIVVAWPVLDWVRQGRASRDLYQKSVSGGPLIEQGIHFQDALRFVTGEEPVEVQAMSDPGTTHPQEGRDSEETTALLVRYASGMLCTHVHNWSYHGAILQLQVVGPSFDLTWSMHGEERLYGTAGSDPVEEHSGLDPYLEEIRGFLEAVRRRDPSLVRSDFADACRSLAVCEAGVRAVETGERVQVPAE